jgi:hypothetical protein
VLGNSTTNDQRFVDPASPLGGTTSAGPGFGIGFNFTFGGVVYDKVGVNANGWISLGSSTVSVPASNTPISGSGVQVMAPFARDLLARANSEIRIETIGTSPNQKLVVQWSNYKRYSSTAGTYDTDTLNFQVVLNETSNAIEYVYGKMKTAATATGDPVVAIKGATTSSYITLDGNFAALVKGSSTSSNVDFNATSAPVVGQTITFSPPTCLAPTNFTGAPLSTTTARLSWTTGGATNWKVQYGALGFTLGTGTKVAVLSNSNTIITGLAPSSTYSFYVKDSCAANDVSLWSGPFTITMPCMANSTFPFVENFEGATTGTPGTLPACFSMASANTYRWEVDVNGTPSSNTGPSVDNTLKSSTGKYVFVEASNGTGGTVAYLNLPAMNTTGLVAPQIEFYYHMYGSQITGLHLQAYNAITFKWDTVFSLVGQQHTSTTEAWKRAAVSLTSRSSAFLQLRFITAKSTTGLDYEGDVALDDMTIGEAPACPQPSFLTATSISSTAATLGWTTGGATNWKVQYGPTGFTLGSGTKVATANNPLVLTGLTPATAYQFYVKDSCSATDVSVYVGPFSFSTTCAPVTTLPWSEGFEGLTAGNLPLCFARTSATIWSTNNTSVTTYNRAPYSGTGYATARYGANDWLFTPEFTLNANQTYRFSFWYISDGLNGWDSVSVHFGQGPLASAMTGKVGTTIKNLNTATTYTEFVGTFTPAVSGNYNLGIFVKANSSPWYLSFDDFNLGVAPSCAQPTSLAATAITNTSATLSWVTGGASNWKVQYGPTGFTPGTGTVVTVTSNPFVLSGLMANTSYDFYVKDSCSATSVSPYSGPVSFTTQCNTVSLPFVEDWEATSATAGCWSAQANWSLSASASANGSGANSITFPFYSVNGGSYDAFSPEFTPVPAGYQLAFDHAYATYISEVDSLDIYYSTDGGASYSLLVGLDGGANGALTTVAPVGLVSFVPTASQWANYTISLPVGTNKLKFTAKSEFGNNLYIDNIAVQLAPLCPAPTALGTYNITTNGAVLHWTSAGNAFNVEYGVTGFTLGSGTTVQMAGNDTIGIFSLQAQTCYDFYVQNACTSDSSAFVGPYNFCTPSVAAICNVANTLVNDTICSPGATNYASANSNQIVMFNSNNKITNVYNTIGFNVLGDSTLNPLAEAVKGTRGGHVGPLTNLPGGFGNFSGQGQWISVLDTIRIDSMTVRANGIVTAQLKIMDDDPLANPAANILQRSKLFTTGAATADYQVELGVIITPGTYFIALDFPSGTGQLFRSTGGAVYPYVLPGLMSIDSVNFAGARIYYTFDLVVSEYCLSPQKTVTTYLIGQNAGVDKRIVLCDNGTTVNLSTYLSANASVGGTFVTTNATAALSGTMFNPALIAPGRYKVYYQTLNTVACPADSATFEILVQNCSGCAALVAPALTGDTTCNAGEVTLSATTASTGVIWYNAADSILSYQNTFTDSINVNTTYKAQAYFRGGPALHVGPPVTVSQNTYPTANFTDGQFISVGATVRLDSATFAVNGPLQFSVLIRDAQNTTNLYQSEVITFNGADTAQKEIGIVLPPGQYFMRLTDFVGTGIVWRMVAGGVFPYGVPGYFTADSSTLMPRYYYFYDLKVSSACLSPMASVQGVVTQGFNAGSNANDTVCDTLMVDLSTYLGVHDMGGTWLDVNNTGALNGSVFNAYSVGKNAIYTFKYVGGTGSCEDTATINLYVDYCSIGLGEYSKAGLVVYPNPTNGVVYVESIRKNSQTLLTEIYSISGKLLLRKQFDGHHKAEIELSNLADGVYNLKVTDDNGTSIHRIVKQ